VGFYIDPTTALPPPFPYNKANKTSAGAMPKVSSGLGDRSLPLMDAYVKTPPINLMANAVTGRPQGSCLNKSTET